MTSASLQLPPQWEALIAAYLNALKTDALMGTTFPWNRGRLLVEGQRIARFAEPDEV